MLRGRDEPGRRSPASAATAAASWSAVSADRCTSGTSRPVVWTANRLRRVADSRSGSSIPPTRARLFTVAADGVKGSVVLWDRQRSRTSRAGRPAVPLRGGRGTRLPVAAISSDGSVLAAGSSVGRVDGSLRRADPRASARDPGVARRVRARDAHARHHRDRVRADRAPGCGDGTAGRRAAHRVRPRRRRQLPSAPTGRGWLRSTAIAASVCSTSGPAARSACRSASTHATSRSASSPTDGCSRAAAAPSASGGSASRHRRSRSGCAAATRPTQQVARRVRSRHRRRDQSGMGGRTAAALGRLLRRACTAPRPTTRRATSSR